MKSRLLPALLVLLGSGLLLGGCATFDADTLPGTGRSLAGLTRFFVVSNLNDNHALDRRIVAALQARGFTADAGPLTMMPDNTQAVVTFQDNWTWDFSEHLVYLHLSVSGPDSSETLSSATFTARIPPKESVAETVARTVAKLFVYTPTAPLKVPGNDTGNPAGTKKRER